MIDYEKLKIASEIAYNSKWYFFRISLGLDGGCIEIIDARKGEEIYRTESLDDLITKLKELTKPAPGCISETLQEIPHQDGYVFLEAGDYQFRRGRIFKVTKEYRDISDEFIANHKEYWNDKRLAEKCWLTVKDTWRIL